tara:strand:- start:11319 stop:12032 length:714 start_codon:yes stop_codon:yes gene_type:complete
MRFSLLVFILFQIGCESNRFDNWNEMKNKIITQESEINSLKKIVSNRREDFSQLKSEISYINNDMQNKIITQKSEIDSLKKIVSKEVENFGKLRSDIGHINNEIKNKKKELNSKIESQIYSIPFIPLIDKIDLSRLIGKKVGLYEVELINIEDLEFTGIDPNIDFQLTLSTRLLNTNKVPQNGLISYYQYSKPQKGIINSTSSKLMVDAQNPYIFLEGNGPYQISGKLVLKISGKFK